MAKNYIKWGDAESTWVNPNGTGLTWGDFYLLEEIVKIVEEGGSSASSRKEKLDKQLDKDKEKKKRVVHLICKIKGVKVFDEKKAIEEYNISVDDIEMLVEDVYKKIKLGIKKDV